MASTNRIQRNGLIYKDDYQCLDIEFKASIDSPPLYEFMNALYTLSDVNQQLITSENFYGNEIRSELFQNTKIGSQFLNVLNTRLRGNNQINTLRAEILNTAKQFSDYIEVKNITFSTDYSTGRIQYNISLFDKTTQKLLKLEL